MGRSTFPPAGLWAGRLEGSLEEVLVKLKPKSAWTWAGEQTVGQVSTRVAAEFEVEAAQREGGEVGEGLALKGPWLPSGPPAGLGWGEGRTGEPR